MIKAVRARGAKSLFLKLLESFGAPVHRDAVLAALATTIAWGPLMRKRISRLGCAAEIDDHLNRGRNIAFEDGVMHARQRARAASAELLSFCLVARVGHRKIGRHRINSLAQIATPFWVR
jgi:hypothetical protein